MTDPINILKLSDPSFGEVEETTMDSPEIVIARTAITSLGDTNSSLPEILKNRIEPQSELSKVKRNSLRVSKNAVRQFFQKETSSENLATPADIEKIKKHTLQGPIPSDAIFVREKFRQRKKTSFLIIPGTTYALQHRHVFHLADKVNYLANGGTILAFCVHSNESDNKQIVLKLVKGGPERVKELVRDFNVLQRLNGKEKNSKGIQQTPYEIRVLSEETKQRILEKMPLDIHGTDIQNTVLLVKKYDKDLDHSFNTLSYMDKIQIASDLFAGMSKFMELGLINLDLKPGNVLLREKDGKITEAVFCDFGTAFFEDEINTDPQLIDNMTWTDRYALEAIIDEFSKSTGKISPKASEAMKKKATKEAISHAKESMAFSFGVLLFELFTKNEDSVHFSCPYVVEKQGHMVEARTRYGYIRIKPEKSDEGPIRFHREAFPSYVPNELIDIIEGLLHTYPSQKITFQQAISRFADFEKTISK